MRDALIFFKHQSLKSLHGLRLHSLSTQKLFLYTYHLNLGNTIIFVPFITSFTLRHLDTAHPKPISLLGEMGTYSFRDCVLSNHTTTGVAEDVAFELLI